MGCTMSSCSRRRSSSSSSFDGARVVNTIGHMVHVREYVGGFVTVVDVTSGSWGLILCTAEQLRSNSFRPLQPHEELKPGHLYFLVLDSFLEDSTFMQRVAYAKRLTTVAMDAKTPVDVQVVEKVSWRPTLDAIEDDEDDN